VREYRFKRLFEDWYMKLFAVCVFLGMILAAPLLNTMVGWLCVVNAQSPQPKFMLSEVETVKVENLKLKSELLRAETTLHNIEVQAFVQKTLKDHGDPANVTWNSNTYSFEVKPTPAAAVSPTTTPTKPVPNAPAVPKRQE
jgi:hypothetical protein